MSRIILKDGRRPPFFMIYKTDAQAIVDYYNTNKGLRPSQSIAQSVYSSLCWKASDAGSDSFSVSYAWIAKRSGCSRPMAIEAVKVLCKIGVLKVRRKDFKASEYELVNVASEFTSKATLPVKPVDQSGKAGLPVDGVPSKATLPELVKPVDTYKEQKNLTQKNFIKKDASTPNRKTLQLWELRKFFKSFEGASQAEMVEGLMRKGLSEESAKEIMGLP